MFAHLWNGISAHEDHTRNIDAEVPFPGVHVDIRSIADGASNSDFENISNPHLSQP